MKKIVSAVALVALLMVSNTADAQLKWGLKGGLNISNISFDESVISKENRTGFFIGPMAEFTIPIIGLGVDGAILYDQKHVEVNGSDKAMHYIDIPINLKYSIGLGNLASVFVATGPQFSFAVGNKEYSWSDLSTLSLNSSSFYWNVGAGVKLINHLQVGYNYSIPCGDTGEWKTVNVSSIGNVDFKNGTHQISVAYLF